MTKPIHRKNSATRMLVIGTIWLLAACSQMNGSGQKGQRMNPKEMALWQTIDRIGTNLPMRREKIEQQLQLTLEKLESSNQYYTFWAGSGGALQDGVLLSRIILGLRNDDSSDQDMLTIEVSGTCLKLDEVRRKYGEVVLVGLPRGGSKNEETTYEATRSWGKLVFGFAERNPDCLSSIGIKPHEKTSK